MANRKQVWSVQISQNGWEYTGKAFITAIKVAPAPSLNTMQYAGAVMADGVHIQFDEAIGEIRAEPNLSKKLLVGKAGRGGKDVGK